MHILDKISTLLITKQWYPETTEFCVDIKIKGLPGSSVVKTLPSKAGGMGSIPVRELRSHMPLGQKKTQKHNTEATL